MQLLNLKKNACERNRYIPFHSILKSVYDIG